MSMSIETARAIVATGKIQNRDDTAQVDASRETIAKAQEILAAVLVPAQEDK